MMLSSEIPTPWLFGLVPWIVFAPVLGLLINASLWQAAGWRAWGWLQPGFERGVRRLGHSVLCALLLPRRRAGEAAGVDHIGTLALDWTFRVDTFR